MLNPVILPFLACLSTLIFFGEGEDWELNLGPCACKADTLLLGPLLQPFCFGYLWNRVSRLGPGHPEPRFSYLYFPLSWNVSCAPPHPAFYCLRGGFANFLPGWLWTAVFLITASQIARIADMSHRPRYQPHLLISLYSPYLWHVGFSQGHSRKMQ
jgi:hypothetical protein